MKETRDRHEHSLSVPHRRADEEFRTLSSSLSVELAARSHPGRRSANEDHYLVVRLGRHLETLATSLPDGEVPARFDETGYGIFVADGMGRLGAGETASRLAISTFAHLVLHYGRWNLRVDPRIADEVIQRGLHFYRSIDELVTETAQETSGRGTTLTVAYIADDTLFLAHVGHSRAYVLRQTSLTQLTRDQTLAQRLDDGAPPGADAAGGARPRPPPDRRHRRAGRVAVHPDRQDQAGAGRLPAALHQRLDGRGGPREHPGDSSPT